MSRLTRGYLISFTGVVLWSTTGILISLLTGMFAMPPLQVAVWRDALVVVGLAPALFLIRRSLLAVGRGNLGFFVLYGLLLAAFNAIWSISVKLNGAGVATVLAYGSAGFTALLAWQLFHEKLGLPKIAAVVLSLGGCVLVANAYDPAMWGKNPLGILVGLLSGLLFAGYTLMGKETAHRGINAWSALLYSFGFAAVFLLVFNLIPGLPGWTGRVDLLPDMPAAGWLVLVGLAWLPTIFGFGLYIVALGYLPASIANLLATLEPVLTAVEAYFLLGERMTLVQLGGGVMIISAVFIVRAAEEWQNSAPAAGIPAGSPGGE